MTPQTIDQENWKIKQLRKYNQHYELNLETIEKDYHKNIENCIEKIN